MQIEAAAAIDQLSNKEISYDEYCKKVLMNKYVLPIFKTCHYGV